MLQLLKIYLTGGGQKGVGTLGEEWVAGIQEKGEESAGGGRSKRVRSRRKNEKLCKYQCFIFHNKIRDKRRKLPRENGRELRIQLCD